MKKKILSCILAVLITACLFGCETSNSAQANTSAVEETSKKEESSTIKALYITPDSCTIKVGERRNFVVQSDKGTEDPTDFLWSSDDNNIATVDFSGNLIGRNEGNCIITVTSKNQAGVNAKVMVKVKPDEQISKTESSVQPSPAPVQESSQVSLIQRQKNIFSYSSYEDAYTAYQLVSNYLTEDDLYGMTKDDIQLLVNTIFAKHGYIFKTNEIQRFFESQYWYNSITNKTRSSDAVVARIQKVTMDYTNLQNLRGFGVNIKNHCQLSPDSTVFFKGG